MKQPIDHGDPTLRPRDPKTGQALPTTAQPGYYSGYSTLGQKAFWDKATRDLVVDRVEASPSLRFFTAEEAKFWAAVFDHLIPQTDRIPERRIAIVPPLDKRLSENRTEGYRFEDMPQDRDLYKTVGIEAINAEAQARYAGDFLYLPHLHQDIVLRALHDGCPQGAPDIWKRHSVHRVWQQLMTDAIDAYYAHPWAWDEIGFGGPAYPRAYMRLERGEPEPWEVEEQPYEWLGPQASVSDEIHDASHHHIESEQHRHKPAPRSE